MFQSFSLLIILSLPLIFGGHFTDFDKIFNQSKDTNSQTISSKKSTGKVVKIIDGDTIDVKLDDSNEIVRVRYIGIDTPESYAKGPAECGSHAATVRNSDLVMGQEVILVADKDDKDRYDRLLRYVYIDEVFVNQVLVEEGLARTLTVQPNTTFKYKFLKLEENAQNDKKGMWGECFEKKINFINSKEKLFFNQ